MVGNSDHENLYIEWTGKLLKDELVEVVTHTIINVNDVYVAESLGQFGGHYVVSSDALACLLQCQFHAPMSVFRRGLIPTLRSTPSHLPPRPR